MATVTTPAPVGIHSDALYRLRDIQQLTGLGHNTIRHARRNGLQIVYHGRVAFVEGGALIEYLKATGKDSREKKQ